MTTDPNSTSEYVHSIGTTIVIGIATSLIALLTTVFNFITLLAFALKKSLRKFGDHFIMNLAIADMAIGVMSIPPYIPYLLTGRWSAGRPYCLFWLLWDYITPAASTFSMCIISLDRYLLVAHPIWYRQHQSTRMLVIMMLTPWVIPTLVYAPSILMWELFYGEQTIVDGKCYVPYAFNLPFLLFGSAVEFIFPLIIMTTLNFLIFVNIRRRSRKQIGSVSLPNAPAHTEPSRGATRVHPMKPFLNPTLTLQDVDSRYGESEQAKVKKVEIKEENSHPLPPTKGVDSQYQESEQAKEKKVEVKEENNHLCPPTELTECEPKIEIQSMTTDHSRDGEGNNKNNLNSSANDDLKERKVNQSTTTVSSLRPSAEHEVMRSQLATDQGSRTSNRYSLHPSILAIGTAARNFERDRKAARALFILVFIFALCWMPYEILALTSAVCRTCINPDLFEVNFWLLWVNSTINPILYPLLHRRFRDAFFSLMRAAKCCQ